MCLFNFNSYCQIPKMFGKSVCVCVCVCVCVLVTQSRSTLCDAMGCFLPGSSVHGIRQARILEWVTTLFSRGSSQPRDQIRVSCIAGRFFTFWVTRENLFQKYSFLELILTFPGNNLIIHQTFCHCKLCVRVDYKGFWLYNEIILNTQLTQDTVRKSRKLRKRYKEEPVILITAKFLKAATGSPHEG